MKLTGRIYTIERQLPDGTWVIDHWWNTEATRKAGMDTLRLVRAGAKARGHQRKYRLGKYVRDSHVCRRGYTKGGKRRKLLDAVKAGDSLKVAIQCDDASMDTIRRAYKMTQQLGNKDVLNSIDYEVLRRAFEGIQTREGYRVMLELDRDEALTILACIKEGKKSIYTRQGHRGTTIAEEQRELRTCERLRKRLARLIRRVTHE